MCWNAKVSLNTYIFSTFTSLLCYYNNLTNLKSFLFYQSFIIMQLIEYFIWSKTFDNTLLSFSAFIITVFFQPLLSILRIQNEKYIPYIPNLIIFYLLFLFISFTFIYPINKLDFSTTPAKNGHLAWNWLSFHFPFILIWFMFFVSSLVLNNEYIAYAFTFTIFSVSYTLYNKTKTFGSLFCWVANLCSLLFIYSIFQKNF